MGAILTRLEAQKTLLEGVREYGDYVSYEQPPSGENPLPQIYLELPLRFEVSMRNLETQVTATWSALVVVDGVADLFAELLDAQDRMMSALLDVDCPDGAVAREDIEPRQSGAVSQVVSVTVTFGVKEGSR